MNGFYLKSSKNDEKWQWKKRRNYCCSLPIRSWWHFVRNWFLL